MARRLTPPRSGTSILFRGAKGWSQNGLMATGCAVLMVIAGVAACGDDDSASPEEPATTTEAGQTTSTTADDGETRCGGGPTEARIEQQGTGWVLHARVADRDVEHRLAIEDRTAEPRVLGSHDIDGDGAEEVFVEVSRGAAAIVIGLVTVTSDCELATVQGPDGFVAQLPVGASAATQRGLACRGGELIELTGETDDGRTYRWSSRTFALVDDTLAVARTDQGTYTSPEDDEEIRRLGSLDCGSVTL